MTTSKLITGIAITALILLLNSPAHAITPADLFREKARSVSPKRYGKRAHAANIDLSGPSRGRKFLRLQLPDGRVVNLKRTRFKDRGTGNALWQGRAVEHSNSRAMLTVKKGVLVGRLTIDEEVYEIRPQRGGKHVVELLDMSAFPECDSGVNELVLDYENDQPADTSGQSVNMASEGEIQFIDLLSVYTPNARNKAGGFTEIEALIQAAVDNANTAFSESNMNVRYQLVHTEEVNYNSQGTTSDALQWVTNSSYVSTIRDQFGADMVSIIVDTPSSCGTGWVQRNPGPSFEAYAFQATDIDCAVGNLTFAHEHGHNMGMEHNWENSSVGTNPSSASFDFSYAHYVNGSYRTVMSYSNPCPNGCPRVARFSNPNVNFAGVPTGIANERDNAQTGDLIAPIINSFRNSVVSINPVVNVRIGQSIDDVEENVETGSMSFYSSDLEFGYDPSASSNRILGLRFVSVNVPPNATITNAYLEFTVDETSTETTSADISILASDSATAFSSNAYDLSNRNTTGSIVYWNIPEWNTVGELNRSPDISNLVQEVVNRSGWNAGNNMAFVINASGRRTAEAWDGEDGSAPLLHIEYTTDGSPATSLPAVSILSVTFENTTTNNND